MSSANEAIARLGGKPRYEVHVSHPESRLVHVEGSDRRRRRWHLTITVDAECLTLAPEHVASRPNAAASGPALRETQAAKEAIARYVRSVTMGRVQLHRFEWQGTGSGLSGMLGGGRFVRCKFIWAAASVKDLDVERASKFGASVAAYVAEWADKLGEVVNAQAQREQCARVATRYARAIVDTARARAEEATECQRRLSEIWAEVDAASRAAAREIEATDELRRSLIEQGECVDEVALAAAYRLAPAHLGRPSLRALDRFALTEDEVCGEALRLTEDEVCAEAEEEQGE